MTKLNVTQLNGKKIAYHSQTQFQVQIGYKKNRCNTRYVFTGNLAQAVKYYESINIGNGYKKRLVMPTSLKPVLLRSAS